MIRQESARPWGVPLLLCVLALFLRVIFLGKQSLDFDEGFSYWVASHTLRVIVQILHYDAHPPLFYSLLHFWIRLGRSETFLRAPFVFLGLVNCLVVYALGEVITDRKTALFTALFWACSYLALRNETWCRMYALATTISLCSTWALWRAYSRPSLPRWALYVFLAALGFYTHYYTGFVIAAHWLFLMYEKKWREAAGVAVILIVVFLPWTPVFFFQFNNGVSRPMPTEGGGALFGSFAWMLFTDQLFRSFTAYAPLALLGMLVFLWGCYRVITEKKREGLLLVFLFLFPCLVPFAITQLTGRHIFVFRYFILFLPFFYLTFFFGLFRLPRAFAYAVFTSLIGVNLAVWWLYLTGPAYQKQNWRQAAAVIRDSLLPGDTLFVEQGSSVFPLAYYLPAYLRVGWKDKQYYDPESPRRGIHWYAVKGESSIPLVAKAAEYSRRQWLVLCQYGLDDPRHAVFTWLHRHRKVLLSYRMVSLDRGPDDILVFLFGPSRGHQPPARK